MSASGGKCVYCGEDATEVDHVIPLCAGGTNKRDNLAACCQACNRKKGSSLDSVWAEMARGPHEKSGAPPVTVNVTVPVPVVKPGEHEDAECARVADGLAWIVPAGRKRLLYRDERVRALVRAGATADEILDVVRRLAEAVESGAEPADRWTATYVFSGWFDRLRDQPAHSEGGRL